MALSLDEALGMSLADEADESIHVDIDTRQITIPESQKLFGVESDADVEVKHIVIDGRYADGNRDLSKLAWRVVYRNAKKGSGYYLIPSVVANKNSIEMDWLIKRSVVAYKGTVDFILCAFATTSSGEVTPEWNSTLGQGIVLKGLETSAIDIGKESVDELSKILYETVTAKDVAVSAASNATANAENAAGSKAAAASSASAAAESEQAAAESKEAAQEAAERATQAGIAASNAAEEAERSAGIATDAAGGSALNAESQSSAKANADAAAKSQQSAAIAAGNSASAAAGSEQAAGTSELKAAKSEKAAKASEQAASESAQAALESKTAAATSEVNAAASAKKAQDVADSLPEDYTTAVNDIATLKQQVANITPDDSSIGDKPWSSKHIIDMLCPPLEESGNPVVCYPVAGYPLGVKAKWEPMQEGSGTPSPENIRPIKGRDSVKVERCGENLLDEARFPITKTVYNIRTTSKMILPAGTYTVCVLSMASGVYAIGADVEHTYDSNKHTFTLARQTAITLDSYWIKGRPEKDENIWLVEGNEWRPYTPYIGSTNTLTLPETVYGGEVDAVSGEGQETWKALTLDGTENWVVSGKFLDNKTDWYYTLPKIPNAVNAAPQKGNEICSHYPHADVSNNNNVQGCAIVWGSIRVRWGDTIPNDADAWKAYLAAQKAAGTPVQVAYKLATQTPFTATGAQPIPALAGVNTVLTDADSVTVTGRADPIKRITDLEDAVASQT